MIFPTPGNNCAFCAKFEEAAQQFTTGPQRRFAQQFADSFLDSWKRELSSARPTIPKPTYSSVAAASPRTDRDHLTHRQQQQHGRRQTDPPHRQGQQTTIAPPRQDLRVFIRLEAGAPARAHSSYTIRTLIQEKLSTISSKIRQVFQVRSGWAVLTADSETRDFLVEKQAEWAAELGATTVETNKEWFTYVVSDFPTRLTDFHGKEVDSDSIVRDEIEIQTGLKPVDIRPSRQFSDSPLTKTLLVSFLKPTKRFWSLFGSSAARLIGKTDRPRQSEHSWSKSSGIRSTLVHHGGHKPSGGYEAEEEPEHPRPGSPRKRRIDNKKPLRIFQANVGKIPPAHDCALALADSERYDIVLLQEPWTAHTDTRSLTKTHPAYDTFTPVETWDGNDTRPRVMTYVRRDPRLLADQIGPFQTRDILWLTINGMTIVNFYRQNDESDALNILIRWPVPERCLIAGDFNARHHIWQTGQATNRGQGIADWASENDLDLLNTPDIPTNPHGNTIDLAFTNMPLAEATVEDHLATSSDHFTLSLTLPDAGLAPMQPGRVRVTTDDELKRFAEIVELGAAGLPTADSTPSELDELASALVNLLTSAAKAAGRPTRKGARTAPWWTEECAGAAAAFRAIRRLYPLGFNEEVQIAKRVFHRVVRLAKRLYWRNLIDTFSDSSSVFKAVRWLKSPGPFQPPPLQVDDVVYESQIDKANALRRATLERLTADDDIQDP
ncbi:hypothetical protein HZS61_007854 [Fusarium oxysporum f. sp. conglutinans]|uniref:Endonuclease/exonuclease/phosphatase domain-containing protein n=1 Tax=Fusarium oxysporum f. sp. conglutinans TaxID=100902 RepID=A0A8H6LNK3_FUSOX|nr:hypothetical protein HZS61_007854 [Fusarium oxysporum f. sp. conglutinans]